MQAKNSEVGEKSKKRNWTLIILLGIVIAGEIFLGIIYYSGIMQEGLDIKETVIFSLIGLCFSALIYFLLRTEAYNKKEKIMVKIATALGILLMVLGPNIENAVYQTTKQNVYVSEETCALSTETIVFKDEQEAEEQIELAAIEEHFVVRFADVNNPYMEVVKYRTTRTIDNQNPWGRKTVNTVDKWTEYTLYIPKTVLTN